MADLFAETLLDHPDLQDVLIPAGESAEAANAPRGWQVCPFDPEPLRELSPAGAA
ncbi:hypothetical protein Bequi_13560 [Brachybacterium sp. JHP9]|uniref:Uncharacterized protein n=1 Tax=Brachybacterium equifaecis TaxID=2910770 RepID=A0ABT0R394_9MICO|nr:hypothetical protein [Brachybacterium equifaecis]MCL6424392.1 hypothetical protein [Brachybacterium equifaecis]